MNHLALITGLMKSESDALGFIPMTTIKKQYIENGRYLVAANQRGYLLHGKLQPGAIVSITQAVVEYDWRSRGYGHDLVVAFIERCKTHNIKAIKLRCADNLDANGFWLAAGFNLTRLDKPNNRRNRIINTYLYDLYPRLF